MSLVVAIKDNNNISDIGFVTNYKTLKTLEVVKNPVKDFSILSQLKEIKELNITETELGDITFLEKLPKLSHLTLVSNEVLDYSTLYSLKNLQYLCMDYKSATTLDLDRIEKNNSGVFIKVENPFVVETVVNYKYNQTIMAKKISDNEYILARINDDDKTYSTEIVSSCDKVEKNYDLIMMALRYKGYSQITKEKIGERKLVKDEPFKVTKEIICVLEKQINIGTTSVSQIQHTMFCGYCAASRILDWMIDNKYVE